MRGGAPFLSLLIALSAFVGRPALAAAPSLELQVELDPASRHFRAQALIAPPTRDFRFQLHESLQPGAAIAGGRPLAVHSTGRQGNLRGWRIILPAGVEAFRLEYGGTLPALDPGLDHRGVLQGMPPMASEEGSFLPAGSAWYPRPAPSFSYRATLSVPAGQRALVPGRLESEELPAEAAGRYRAAFSFPHPADGIDLMAGPWVVREKIVPRADGGPVRLRTYFPRDLDALPGLADGYLADTRRYLERYSGEIGPYPFTEFSVVAGPLPTGFGIPTLAYLGVEVLKLPFIRATSLGHEVLHNWWGNGVYVDYERGNWCEGLTTFMADYAYKEEASAEAAREMRLGWLRDFAAVPEGTHPSLAAFRSRTHGAAAAAGYGKGAMVLFMLRDAIGEDAFRRGLRTFWEKYRFKAAAWDDLRAAFEEAANQPLGDFFGQWVNRGGAPRVAIADAEARHGAGDTRLTVVLDQEAPPYRLRLPLEMSYPDRSEIRWVNLVDARSTVTLETGRPPRGVRVDPELRVWRRLGPEQLPPILRQWIVAPAPRLIPVSHGPEVAEASRSLGKRLFESPPRPVALEALDRESGPVLLVGLHADVDDALAWAGLPGRPAELAGRGSAQVWTVRRENGAPLAVVSVKDGASLQALLRPLPHYGSQSWLVFDGGRAIGKGIWPAPGRLIPVRQAE